MYPTDEDVNYIHLDVGEGNATVAIQTVTEGYSIAYVSVAFCSPKDQFSRKIGRLISRGRLKKNKFFFELTVDPERSITKQVLGAFTRTRITNSNRFPSWV